VPSSRRAARLLTAQAGLLSRADQRLVTALIARSRDIRDAADLANAFANSFSASVETAPLQELESGGRLTDAVLTGPLLPALSREILERMRAGRPLARVHVGATDGRLDYAFG
jgi:type VI secretion system protein VasG